MERSPDHVPLAATGMTLRESLATTACQYTAWGLVPVLSYFMVWNLSKLPALASSTRMTNVTFDPDHCGLHPNDPDCFGPELQANLWSSGWRAVKLIGSLELFVAPHVAMGCLLELLFVLVLLQGFDTARSRAKIVLPLAAAFAIHILPLSDGFPARVTGAQQPGYATAETKVSGINTSICVLILMACVLGVVSLVLSSKMN